MLHIYVLATVKALVSENTKKKKKLLYLDSGLLQEWALIQCKWLHDKTMEGG